MNETLKLTLDEIEQKIATERKTFTREKPYRHTDDMNLASELLGEMPDAYLAKSLSIPGRWEVCYYLIKNGVGHRRCMCHSEIAVAICLAWLQWKTGEVVEVVE